jgi:Recombination endonuclease VII
MPVMLGASFECDRALPAAKISAQFAEPAKIGLKCSYRTSLEEYEQLLVRQNGACPICGKQTTKRLCVDHCHATGRVRGLLCSKCNLGIGQLDDDPGLMRAAIAYVSRRQEDQPP